MLHAFGKAAFMTTETIAQGSKDKVDFGRMSFDQILQDPRVSNNFKSQIMVQLQRVGNTTSVIKVSDFERLSIDEEIDKKRKATEDLLNKDRNFETQKRIFLDALRNEKEQVSKELDNINDLINTIKDKEKHKKDITKLKKYRNMLRSYFSMIGWFTKEETVATSMKLLGTVMNQFRAAARVVYDNRDKILFGLGVTLKGAADLTKLAGQGLGQVGRMVLSFL